MRSGGAPVSTSRMLVATKPGHWHLRSGTVCRRPTSSECCKNSCDCGTAYWNWVGLCYVSKENHARQNQSQIWSCISLRRTIKPNTAESAFERAEEGSCGCVTAAEPERAKDDVHVCVIDLGRRRKLGTTIERKTRAEAAGACSARMSRTTVRQPEVRVSYVALRSRAQVHPPRLHQAQHSMAPWLLRPATRPNAMVEHLASSLRATLASTTRARQSPPRCRALAFRIRASERKSGPHGDAATWCVQVSSQDGN